MKNIIITGCSSGIGLCLALGLKNEYNIIATVKQPQDLQKIQALGLQVYQLDLSDENSITTAHQQILSKNENIYAIIHNGAYGQVGALEDISRQTLEQQFASNLFGIHQLTSLFLANLRLQKSARIIYISSVLGFVTLPFRGCYNASKFALEGLAATLRQELTNTNIRISIIQPGPVESDFRKNAYQAFKDNVDKTNSHYQDNYQKMIKRLKNTNNAKWTLPASSVLVAVQHALKNKPKNYYRITFPTKLLNILIKILPSSLLDKILINQ